MALADRRPSDVIDRALEGFDAPRADSPALAEILNSFDPLEVVGKIERRAMDSVRQGDAETGRRLLELGLCIARAVLGRDPRTARMLTELANCQHRLGRYAGAIALLEEALAMMIALRGDHHPDLLPVLIRVGRLFLKLGRLNDAWKYSERALKIAEAAYGPRSIELAKPLACLAEVYFALGLLDKCHFAADRALAILRSGLGEDHVETAKARVRLGVALADMGAYHRARELQQSALAVMRAHGRRDWIAAILASLAEIDLAVGEFAQARSLEEEALATARAVFGETHPVTGAYLAAMGDCLARTGEEAGALALYQQALAVLRAALGEAHPDVARVLLKWGGLRGKRDAQAGRDAVFQAIAILASRHPRARVLADAYLFLARMLEPDSAGILFWKLAVNDIDSVRSHVARLDGKLERTFLRRNADDFRDLADALICRGRLPEAQQVLAMIKEREHFSLTGIDARRTKASLTALETQWMRRGARVRAALRSSLGAAIREESLPRGAPASQLRVEIAHAGTQLRAWFDELCAAFLADEASTDAAACASIPPWATPAPGTALLQYLFASDRRSMNIILTTSRLQREYRIRLAEGEPNRLVFAMRESVQARSGHFLDCAQRLYRMLVAPVAQELRAGGVGTLVFWLDDVLRYVPIAALHDGEHYLIEEFALTLAAGAGAATEHAGSVPRAAGLGVSRAMPGYPSLPAVREELAAVIHTGSGRGGVLPGIIRLDEAFTAQELRRAVRDNSVIHIASHFVFEAAQEDSSYLVLGDGSKLALPDFADLRFDAVDMVVLSACNTAISGGHRQSGREIEGLGALVRSRGARKVLATLWPVADLTTAALMRDFYRRTYEAGLHPADALRQAQLAFLADRATSSSAGAMRGLIDDAERDVDTSHPFYWAPYVLTAATGQA